MHEDDCAIYKPEKSKDMKETKTPQQILQESREEFEKKLRHQIEIEHDSNKSRFSETFIEAILDCMDNIHTSILQAFVAALIARTEGMKKISKYPWQSLQFDDCPQCGLEVNRKWVDEKCKEIYLQGIQDQISHYNIFGFRNFTFGMTKKSKQF